MTEQKRFPIETILSCVAFYKIDNNLPVIGNAPTLVNLIAFMDTSYEGDERLALLESRRALLMAAAGCGYLLVKKYPELGDVTYPHPHHRQTDPESFIPWIEELYPRFGSEMMIECCDDVVLNDEERAKIERVRRILRQRHRL